MEVARPFFHSPQQQHHLAELRIEADQSPVAFSDPCAVGRKRRCLFPAFSPRKKMLLELPPFSSAPAPSSPASTGHTTGAGSNGSFAFRASPRQPFAPAGSNGSGAPAFLASHERPLTPMGSTATSGFGILASQLSLSPGPSGPTGTAASAVLASPKSVRTGTTKDGGGLTFSASPLSASAGAKELTPPGHGIRGHGGLVVSPPFVPSASRTSASAGAKELTPPGHGIRGHGGLVVSPPFVLSASRTSASPVRNSDGGTIWSRRRRGQQHWEEQLQITLPPQNVGKTEALAIGDPPRSAALSESSAKPCCMFLKSPAKACKQDAQKATIAASDASHQPSPHRSPSRTCCTFVTSPISPSSAEKATKRERGVQVPSVAAESPASLSPSPAACAGAEVVVRVTCSCGIRKEFCFDHCH